MRWAWSNALLSTFTRKYKPIFEALGYEVDSSERLIKHVGGVERMVTISIFRGDITRRHLVITEVESRDGRWLRVASTYSQTGVVRKGLDEQVWKAFYSQLNKIVASCVLDLIHEVGNLKICGSAKFSLAEGLELQLNGTKFKIPISQIAETPKIIALSSL